MTNFKSGSGNLDFGDDGDDDGTDEGSPESAGASRSVPPGASDDASPARADGSAEARDGGGGDTELSAGDAGESGSGTGYPYFVRRNNVGDERDRRLEVHVRDGVAERESEFRAELADRLGVSEVSKTDAREFALLAAYEHPERVAELLREEGFGAVD